MPADVWIINVICVSGAVSLLVTTALGTLDPSAAFQLPGSLVLSFYQHLNADQTQ